MNGNVFYEMEFILLVIFSLVIPVGIYGFLYKTFAISRWTVVGFALLLVVVAGIDVVLLQTLFEKATTSHLLIDNKIFRGQLSIALYLFPAAFAGLGVNLLSHVLTGHLNQAEQEFDKEHRNSGRRGSDSAMPNIRGRIRLSEPSSEVSVITGSALAAAAIFVLDLWTGADIRLHVLYIFPLAMVARHCARPGISAAALTLTTILQVITFSEEAAGMSSFISDVCVAFAASVMVTYLARTSRRGI